MLTGLLIGSVYVFVGTITARVVFYSDKEHFMSRSKIVFGVFWPLTLAAIVLVGICWVVDRFNIYRNELVRRKDTKEKR